ncbi:MAG: prolyl 4-hydroxylase subunit alpha [Deltaproteobacteria bacterium]|nr:prolyl 4-hydroxylase subunit alpha [Deltaproteobacteria bacterium]
MTIKKRLESLDWQALEQSLWDRGYTKTSPLLTPDECSKLIALYDKDEKFRSRTNMARHQFGLGEYKYFADPLPPLVHQLREHSYTFLAPMANRWMEALRIPEQYPPTLVEFLDYCREHGQTRPTPLLLSYEAGGYNCLHQDLYGAVAFPLQLTFFLSRREQDYTGGEFLLFEQRPRAQSRGEAIANEQGEMLIFTTRYRPALGKRGYHRVQVRHGVSTITSGSRYTLGVIFHNAK